ncbi:ATP-dependent helicase [Croceivirga lutea]|uniref:UvrD-helicase domain-containing protein n=1 Tax=Croceivirga lutea TaxID=1775167 RepID=UPI00163A1B7C|nr:UvrD-helicase domain-containing protein [Croceivirga lutea]GGG38174.1 ATP-dependent helicase [Croceivirga lutea]
MIKESFKILSASAGTGKTYRLTKAFLVRLLEKNSLANFRSLLAITFTNKAVSEMKQRILDNLVFFSKESILSKPTTLFSEIALELNLSNAELQQRAKHTLKNLLHHYAFFDISTIDRFNHRLVRTFAKDLNISQNFNVELDIDYILSLSVNQLLSKAGSNDLLTKIFIDFALNKIEDGKSWDIAYDLNNIGQLLFQENHYAHLKSLEEKSIADFFDLKKALLAQINSLKNEMINAAKNSNALIKTNGLEPTDFTRKLFPAFLTQVINDPTIINFNAAWKQEFETTILYNKSTNEAVKTTIDGLKADFMVDFTKIKNSFDKISFLERVLKNIVPLTLLAEIQKELTVLKNEEGFLTINEFNELIAKEIKKQPIPYIYERLGERYRHYYIDEFQDTSFLQWHNLIPLVSHAIESEDQKGNQGSILLVGDVKQSIYRWRGGEPEQFLNLVLQKENPFTIISSVEQLNKNWRSHEEIIHFNNSFFTFIANKLTNSSHSAIFTDGNKQQTNEKKGGFVKLSFLPNEKNEESNEHCFKTLEHINEIINSGYALEDITILVRDKKNEKKIANYLIEQNIPVVSSDALLLNSSLEIKFLIAFAEWILNPEENEHQYAILEFLVVDVLKQHDFYTSHLNNLPTYLNDTYDLDLGVLKHLNLIDFFEHLILKFKLAEQNTAYITAFLDEVFQFDSERQEGLFAFVDYWKLKQDKLSLPMPAEVDAVKIFTIHKSKGLEFKFVIFPFADTQINDSRKQNNVWVNVEPSSFAGFSEVMIKNHMALENYSDNSKAVYEEENQKSELDDLNVLYVALTRAVYGLYIISVPVKEKSTQRSYASFFKDYIEQTQKENDENAAYQFGKIEKVAKKQLEKTPKHLSFIQNNKTQNDFPIATVEYIGNQEVNEAILFGNKIHDILSNIKVATDVDVAVDTYVTRYNIGQSEKEQIKQTVSKVVNNNQLQHYFSEGLTIKNEVEILTEDNVVLRPDRLVIKENRATIIDYKTGIPSHNHEIQLNSYAHAIQRMGYQIEEKLLVYINEEIKTLAI